MLVHRAWYTVDMVKSDMCVCVDMWEAESRALNNQVYQLVPPVHNSLLSGSYHKHT